MSIDQRSTDQTTSTNRPIWVTIGAVVALVLIVAGGVALKASRERALAKVQAERAAVEKFQAETNAARQAMAAEYEQTGGNISPERQEELLKKMEAMGKSTGGDLEILTTAVAEIGREWTELGKNYSAFVTSFSEAGGLGPTTMVSLATIDARLKLVEDGKRINNEITRSVRGAQNRLEKMLLDKGMNPKGAREAAAGAASKWTTILEMREIQSRFLGGAEDYLTTLREQWGAWSIQQSSGKVMFQKQDAADRFNDASQRVQQAGADEAEWMKNFAK